MDSRPDFTALVEQHGKEIYLFLYRLLQESPEAEDCLQETFMRAFQAYDRLAHTDNLRAWLYRIANNQAMTHLKRRSQLPLPLTADLSGGGPSPEHQVEQRMQLDQLRSAVSALPHKQQAALVMRKYQELGYDQIGEALDITAEAARANVYQGLRKLRQSFNQDEVASGVSAGLAAPSNAGE